MKTVSATAIFCLMANFAFAQNNPSATGSKTESGDYLAEKCHVILIEDIELPALESGKLTQILVKQGDHVLPDAHLAQMDDTRAQRMKEEATHQHQIADDQASDSTQVNTAYKRYQLAFAEHTKMNKLRQSGSMSEQQAERAKVSAEIAQLEYYGAKKVKELAAIEAAAEMVTLQAAEDSIQRHALKSPINGVVYEVLKDAGEWVTAGETVMKIARMDRLRIPAIIDGNQIDPHEIDNCKVTATLTLARGQQITFDGEIVSVDVKKRMGNTYMAWAEVGNRVVASSDQHWLLQPGCVVDMRIHLGQNAMQSASTNFAPVGGMNK